MIWKSYKFNWLAINNSTVDYQIWLSLVNWRKLDTRDEQIALQWIHGAKSSPTLANARIIEIEWVIEADTRVWLSKAMDYLDSLFALQSRWFTTEYKQFVVVDEQDREFWIDTKIKQNIEYDIDDDDFQDGADRRFRVVIQWDDPRFFETIENMVEWSEWSYGWITLWTTLWVAFNEYTNDITVIWTWNIWTPCRFVITALNDINTPFEIKNITTDRFLGVDEDFIAGDVLEIDTKNYTITKNGTDIKALRIAWSSWLQIQDVTKFVFTDADGIIQWSDFDVKIYFSNVLL